MKDELFDELVASVREGGKILRGKTKPSRLFVIEVPDVKEIRSNYKLSQPEFAALMGISVKTLLAAKHPEVIWDVVKVKSTVA